MSNDNQMSKYSPDFPQEDFTENTVPEVQPVSTESVRQMCFQYTQDGFSVVDRNGLHVDANPAFCRMTGFSAAELIGSKPENCYWPPEEYDCIQAAFAKVLRGELSQIVLTFMRKNGERFPASVDPFAIRDSEGEICFLGATVRDITQQVELQANLQKSEERSRSLFDHAGDGIVIVDGEKAVDCNQRLLEIYNISRDQLFGLPPFGLSPPKQPNGQDSREFYMNKFEACRNGNPQTFEWSGQKLDGTPIETEVTLSTLMHNGRLCTQSIIRDITARKELETTLRNSEVRFRVLYENAGDAIAIMQGGQIIDCNNRTSDIYGIPREEILSTSTSEFFPSIQPNGRDSRELFQEMVMASRSGQPQHFEWHGRNRAGTAVITEVSLTSFTLGDKIYEQSISRDITQRKQMEAALVELNSTLEKRVAKRTEELETACAELLQRNLQYRALARKLTQAEDEERKRIARLLHDNHQQLLAAAKFKAEMLQSGGYGAQVSDQGRDILNILDQAQEVTRSLTMELDPPILFGEGFVSAVHWLAQWMQKHHNLQVSVNGSLPNTSIDTDVSSLLIRAVRELLFNVSKHAGVDHASVTITLVDCEAKVTVSDEGVGFDVAAVMQIASYGLLSIQEQLVSHNGYLDIYSAHGCGTTCTLTIPMSNAGISQREVLTAADEISKFTTEQPQALRSTIALLVVDDHAPWRQALVQILELIEDFNVVGEAVDGLDAVEKARLLRPDVILMDASMPRLDGLQATRRITAELPEIKVIGLTMHHVEDMLPQMLAVGASSCLQKLTPAEVLFAKIREVVQVTDS